MIKYKKSLGQNFLTDKNILNKIVRKIQIFNKNIIEIGAGTGNLSEFILAQKPKSLLLIEKDKHLIKILLDKFKKSSKVKILNSDILDLDLNEIIPENSLIFGNLPYNVSTKILIKSIKLKNWPPKYSGLVFMFQKEVAERLCAEKNSSAYGRLSIISSFRLKILDYFDISKNCFFPKPKVDSTIIFFKPYFNNYNNLLNFKKLEDLTRLFFSNKRKMINKPLRLSFNNDLEIAKKFKLNLKMRPSEIDKEIYFKLAEINQKKFL